VLPELCQPVRSRVEILKVEASHFEVSDRVQTVATLVCAVRHSPLRSHVATRVGVAFVALTAERILTRRVDVGMPIVRRGGDEGLNAALRCLLGERTARRRGVDALCTCSCQCSSCVLFSSCESVCVFHTHSLYICLNVPGEVDQPASLCMSSTSSAISSSMLPGGAGLAPELGGRGRHDGRSHRGEDRVVLRSARGDADAAAQEATTRRRSAVPHHHRMSGGRGTRAVARDEPSARPIHRRRRRHTPAEGRARGAVQPRPQPRSPILCDFVGGWSLVVHSDLVSAATVAMRPLCVQAQVANYGVMRCPGEGTSGLTVVSHASSLCCRA
jgi:hypothetical protein